MGGEQTMSEVIPLKKSVLKYPDIDDLLLSMCHTVKHKGMLVVVSPDINNFSRVFIRMSTIKNGELMNKFYLLTVDQYKRRDLVREMIEKTHKFFEDGEGPRIIL
jgi:hypothetical protein